MDKEFHYYLTYLIAARAGFQYDDALTIARACQAVDENTHIINVAADSDNAYSNYVSQTASLIKPRYDRMRIYPVFHFIPGDSKDPSTRRTDRQTHILNTTPDSRLANQCFDRAAETNDLMQIGIAAHAYADTWAHQNFVGYKHVFNGLKGIYKLVPSIGHADMFHSPDWPAHIWKDNRLIKAHRTINNKRRFLDAAKRLYEKFCAILSKQSDRNERNSLLSDIDFAIGDEKWYSFNRGKSKRIRRYISLSQQPEYNARTILDFKLDDWKTDAIKKYWQINEDGVEKTFVEWKSPKNYKQTKWYLFQEAVKQYQKQTLEIYFSSVYSQLAPGLQKEIMRFG